MSDFSPLNPLGMTGVYLVVWALSLACMTVGALGLIVRALALRHLRRCPRTPTRGIVMSGNTCTGNTETFAGRTIIDIDLTQFEGADIYAWEDHSTVVPRQPAMWDGRHIAVRGTYYGAESFGVGSIWGVTDDAMIVWVDVASLMCRETCENLGMLRPIGTVIGHRGTGR